MVKKGVYRNHSLQHRGKNMSQIFCFARVNRSLVPALLIHCLNWDSDTKLCTQQGWKEKGADGLSTLPCCMPVLLALDVVLALPSLSSESNALKTQKEPRSPLSVRPSFLQLRPVLKSKPDFLRSLCFAFWLDGGIFWGVLFPICMEVSCE